MTREDTLRWLNNLIEGRKDPRGDNEIDTALKEAVKIIEKEPCEDCISRAYIEPIIEELENICVNGDEHILDLLADIKNAPSVKQEPKTEKVIKMRDVTPEERESIEKYIKSISKPTGVDFGELEQEPKTGHWIDNKARTNLCNCSECGALSKAYSKYCPKCGAKMK